MQCKHNLFLDHVSLDYGIRVVFPCQGLLTGKLYAGKLMLLDLLDSIPG